MACSEGGQIRWADFYEVAEAIDNAAEAASVPDWVKITEPEEPYTEATVAFAFNDVVEASFWHTFELAPGDALTSPTITNVYASTNSSGTPDNLNNYANPQALKFLADNNMLMFVADADGCWCKTVFLVELTSASGTFRLKTATGNPKHDCCQTLEVPDIGDDLDYDQHWIPAGYVKQWSKLTLETSSEYEEREIPKCTETEDGVVLRFDAEEVEEGEESGHSIYTLTMASRKVSGYFTWPIKGSMMTLMRNKLNFIYSSAVARPGMVKTKANGEERNVGGGCWAGNLNNMCATWDYAGDEVQVPGSFCCNTDPSATTYVSAQQRIWTGEGTPEQLCGTQRCDDLGPRVYCETLRQLKRLADELLDYTYERTDPPIPVYLCCCTCCVGETVNEDGSLSLEASEIPDKLGLPEECTADMYTDRQHCYWVAYCQSLYPWDCPNLTVNGQGWSGGGMITGPGGEVSWSSPDGYFGTPIDVTVCCTANESDAP